GRVGADESHDAPDVGALRRVLLVGEFPARDSADHQGASTYRDQRRVAREHAARRRDRRTVAAARGARRVDGAVLCDRIEDFPMALNDLPTTELGEHGREVLEWISAYLDEPSRYPVLSQAKPGDVRASLPASPPAQGETLRTILDDFERKIIPGITHWNHPA